MRVFRHVGTPLTQFGFAIFGMFGKFKHFLVCEHVLEGGGGKGFRPYPGPSGGTDGKFGWYSSSETQGQKVGARESLNGPPLSAPGSPRMGGALPRQQARGVDSACERGGEARRLA